MPSALSGTVGAWQHRESGDPDARSRPARPRRNTACIVIVEGLRNRLETWFLDYVDPAVDGVREPVTGTGQIERAGPANGGCLAFLQDQRLDKEAQLCTLVRDRDVVLISMQLRGRSLPRYRWQLR